MLLHLGLQQETLAHQNIMLQRNTEPENARSTNCSITD